MTSKNAWVFFCGALLVAAFSSSAQEVDATSNIRFVANIPYVAPNMGNSNGTDIEFGEFAVPVLGENGGITLDENGKPLFEIRDFAFAGSINRGIFIFDITDPENAFLAAKIDCNVNQADIQVRPDLGLLSVGVDSNTTQCGLGGTRGVLLIDVTDPRFPEQISVFRHARGAHNHTFHPTEPLIYLSDSDLANTGLGQIPIVDVSDPVNPLLVNTFSFHAHSPHDVTFNADGTRAYSAAITHTDILDTSDPRNPALITTINDPAINIHHQSDPTPDGRFLIIGDELAGAAFSPQCPGGGLHFYDISVEQAPVKVGVFFADDTQLRSLCTAHVFRIHPDGRTLTMGWYSAGTRVVDISDPVGLGAVEIAHMIPSGLGGNPLIANSWASKMWKGNYIYSNDRNRGLDIMQLVVPEAAADVTDRIELQAVNARFSSGTARFDLRLKNISDSGAAAPLSAEVVSLDSQSGNVTAANADNGEPRTGAFWRYDDRLNGDGELAAGEISQARTLAFNDRSGEAFSVTFRVLSGSVQDVEATGSASAQSPATLIRVSVEPLLGLVDAELIDG